MHVKAIQYKTRPAQTDNSWEWIADTTKPHGTVASINIPAHTVC